MSGSLRWGDSDSSDEDEIRVSSLQLRRNETLDNEQGQQDKYQEPAVHVQPIPDDSAPPLPSKRRGQQYQRSSSAVQYKQKGTNARSARSRSGGGRLNGPPPQDWKQLAKSSSRFGGVDDSTGSLDGNAWMAQRRAKLKEQEESSRQQSEERKKKEEDERKERRQSQLRALKATVQGIDEQNLSSSSSLNPPVKQGTDRKLDQMTPPKILQRPVGKDEGSVSSVLPAANSASKTSGDKGPVRKSDLPAKGEISNTKAVSESNVGKQGDRDWERGKVRPPAGGRGGGRGRGRGDNRRYNSKGRGGRERNITAEGSRGDGEAGSNHNRSSLNRAVIEKGKPQIVRTSSGTTSYFIEKEGPESKTRGRLMPDGSVRLSKGKRSKGKGKGADQRRNTTRSPLRTKIEIGKDDV